MIETLRPLVEAGFAIVPLKPESKMPADDGWSTAPVPTFKQLERRLTPDHNAGVRLGKWSEVDGGYLHVIDVDIRDEGYEDDVEKALKKLFGNIKLTKFPKVKSGSGGPSHHIYFVTNEPFPSKKLAKSTEKVKDSKGKVHFSWEIDLFGTGKQVVLPPSIHPDTGNPYKWLKKPDFHAGIPSIDADLIAELVYGDSDGEIEPNTNKLTDVTLSEVTEYLKWLPLPKWCDDRDGWIKVGMALHHQFDGSKEAFEVWCDFSRQSDKFELKIAKQQWRSFKHKTDRPVRLATIIEAARQASILADFTDIEDDSPSEGRARRAKEPDMSILQQSLIAAPELPLSIFGPALAAEIKRQARNQSAPVDFVAAAVLCGASSTIGNSIRIEAKRGFQQAPILWGQIIGPPSSKKSPALKVVTGILNTIESHYEPFYFRRLEQWEREKKMAEIRLKMWEAKFKSNTSEEGEGEDEEVEIPKNCQVPKEPSRRQFILNDLTIEAFMRAQNRNPRGFMVFRDELAGWIGNMERYSSESERGAWLESYDGGSYAVERVKDGGKTLHVKSMFAPVLGGIQPERLLDIVSQSVVDDGLQARFMPFWPEAEIIPMSEGGEESTWLLDLFQKLSELVMDRDEQGCPKPYIVKFSKKAFATFKAWSDKRESREKHTPARLGNAFGKATGQVVRLAGVLEYLWWASEDDFEDSEPPDLISEKAVKAAILFREEYLKVMQRRVYTQVIEPLEVTNARLIAQWIVDSGEEVINASILRREAGLKGMNSHTPADIVDNAIATLISLGWLSPEEIEKKGRGRPAKNFIVNERIWDLIEK